MFCPGSLPCSNKSNTASIYSSSNLTRWPVLILPIQVHFPCPKQRKISIFSNLYQILSCYFMFNFYLFDSSMSIYFIISGFLVFVNIFWIIFSFNKTAVINCKYALCGKAFIRYLSAWKNFSTIKEVLLKSTAYMHTPWA